MEYFIALFWIYLYVSESDLGALSHLKIYFLSQRAPRWLLHRVWIEYCNIHKKCIGTWSTPPPPPPWSSVVLGKWKIHSPRKLKNIFLGVSRIRFFRFRVFNHIFVKCLIQRNPFNHYMHFNLIDLKDLKH